jgi:HlyB family type I secretion system ABC transporter
MSSPSQSSFSQAGFSASGFSASGFSHVLDQGLTQLFAETLTESQRDAIAAQIEVFDLAAGELLWSTPEPNEGLYIVLMGKVRLLDAQGDLIVTLKPAEWLGMATLFPQEAFQRFGARASFQTQVGFLSGATVAAVLAQPQAPVQTPARSDAMALLHQHAVWQDLVLLCHGTIPLCNLDREQWVSFVARWQLQPCPGDRLSGEWFRQQALWLVRHGELGHPAGPAHGSSFSAGSLEPSGQFTQQPEWQVRQPVELYGLSSADWQTALAELPQLAEFLDDGPPGADDARLDKTENHSVSDLQATDGIPLQEPFQRNRRSRPTPVARALSRTTPRALLQSNAATEGVAVNAPLATVQFPRPRRRAWWRLTGRYPLFEQHSMSDCGVACLVMVGRYWGKRFSVNQLRTAANVDRSGATLRGLIMAAESIGFSTRPVKASLNRLKAHDLPAIAHWEGKHYIVVYAVTRSHVIVADPAIGRRRLTHAEFQTGWTGYTLLLKPTPFFKTVPEAKQTLWTFFELIKPHRGVLLEIFLASVMLQILGLATPLFTQFLLDRVVVQRSQSTLIAVGVGLILFSVFRVLMSSLRQYLLYHTANRVDLALVVGFISHVFRLPLSYFETRYVGDITSRVQENRKIRQFLTSDALTTVLDMLTVFVYVGLMIWYSWQLALISLIIVPLFTVITLVTTPFLRRVSREIFSAKTTEGSYLIEALTGIGTVKAMGIERTVRWHWEDLFNQSIRVNFSGQMIRERLRLLSNLIETLVMRVTLVLGVWQVINGQLTIGQLVAFNMLLGNVISPFQRLISLWDDFQEVLIAVERINDVLDTQPEELPQASPRLVLPPIAGHVRFEQVTFRYNPESETNTLSSVSFEVKPGQTVAVVGRSGSGKSTIAKLLLGLYPPTEGRITIDGYDLAAIERRSLRQQVGVVDQDTFLFGGTIRENLLIACPTASLRDLKIAARLAGADTFIQDLPMQYDTQIGEGGGLLSGGQRQRLAIARALLSRPRLLILDEATSSLDAESERVIQTHFATRLSHQTTLVIAHRLSTIRHADLILVLDRGVLVEQGTHAELMAQRGNYFYLNQQQLATAD